MISSAGDSTSGQIAKARKKPFENMAPSTGKKIKHLLWLDDDTLEHHHMALRGNNHLTCKNAKSQAFEIMKRTTFRFPNKYSGRYPNLGLGRNFVKSICPKFDTLTFEKK